MEFDQSHDLPISQNIIKQMSFATIKNLIDALVELIANSDDSYKRLEIKGLRFSPAIDVVIIRKKGGICQKIQVRDFAEGMDRPSLTKAITFAEAASGIQEGKGVRGFFGRGLKESIIALGRGQIETIKDGLYDIAEIWFDNNKNAAQYRVLSKPVSVTPDLRKGCGILNGNGTLISIEVHNEKIKCPDYNTFKQQLSNHYALRDINSSHFMHGYVKPLIFLSFFTIYVKISGQKFLFCCILLFISNTKG